MTSETYGDHAFEKSRPEVYHDAQLHPEELKYIGPFVAAPEFPMCLNIP